MSVSLPCYTKDLLLNKKYDVIYLVQALISSFINEFMKLSKYEVEENLDIYVLENKIGTK